MPAAVPNGAPPQWGQGGDLKANVTSQNLPSVTATNGTRSSSQHSHPGSLSSHSSRDSSPAPSRIGVVHPNAWSAGNPPNHSPLPSGNPTNNQGHYQQHNQPSANNVSNPTGVNHPQPVGASSVPHYQHSSAQIQNMPPSGSLPPRPQQNLSTSVASVPQPTIPAAAPPVFGPPQSQLGNRSNFDSQTLPQSQHANTLFASSTPHDFQSQASSVSSSVAPQYSQAPSNQQVSDGQQQNPLSSQKPIASAFPRVAASSQMSVPAMQGSSSSGQEGFSRQAQHMFPAQQMPMASGLQAPSATSSQVTSGAVPQTSLSSGQHMSPGAVNQVASGSEPRMPSTQAHQLTPGSGHQAPPSLGQQQPSNSGHQMPHNLSHQLPSGLSPQMPTAPGHRTQNAPPSVLGQNAPQLGQQSHSTQEQQMLFRSGQGLPTARPMPPMPRQQMPISPGQNLPIGPGAFHQTSSVPTLPRPPMYPGQQVVQRPPGPPSVQGTPLQSSSIPWPSGPGLPATGGIAPPRGPLPAQPSSYSAPHHTQPYSSSQQQFSMPNLSQPNQSLSGPPLQRSLQPTGQFISNQNHLAQPLSPQAPVFAGNDSGVRRYPQHPQSMGQDSLMSPMSNLSVTQTGFNKLWGQENYDLLQNRNILPPEKVEAPQVRLTADFQNSANCSPDIFRCTLTRIPETDSLLKKSRLPLGVLIHPFKDLNNLPVIQCTPIVRCRVCRTYINPFVYFMDEKHWKCNLCFRVNELPDEFHYDPATKTYGEPMRRPEVKSSTIEFIAPAEYMLRPPQPAVYLFLLDVSRLAVESGYLQLVCETLLAELDRLPGDGRTSVGFITYDSAVHFYSLAEGLSVPQQMVVMDIDDVFLPCPENLLANLGERRDLIQNMLVLLPSKFSETYDTGSALGAALQAAFKLMSPTGGRVTVFQCCLPNKGPGALKPREDPANRASKDVPHLNPATDFYKQLALEFSGQQTAVDLFLLNQQYSDLATLSGVARFSGGCIYHFPLFQSSNIQLSESLENAFRRYLDRKIGFEAVMRIRCSRGLSIHTFHGNFYVRSTDLLSLPNINPDAGFGMQVSIEENLSDMQTICFQAALLYTSGKGERRIRVHTLCLPIAASLPDILHSADQQCIIGLLAKMAVDRSQQSSLSDARDAFINVVIDALSAYKLTQSSSMGAGLLAPKSLRLLPLYILALLKNMAFRSGTTTRLDDRVYAMCQMKTLPLSQLIQFIYPDLYPVHCLDQYEQIMIDNVPISIPPRLHLSAEKVNSQGAFLMDAGDQLLILVGRAIPMVFCENVLGVSSFSAIPEDMYELPDIDCEDSRKLRNFVSYLQSDKPSCVNLHIIREDSKLRSKFFDRLIEDRTESSLSYYEFLQHIKSQIK